MLSFKRILNSEFPLRMLPLDALEVQDEDGFDMIVQTPTQCQFIATHSLEQFMKLRARAHLAR